MAAPIQNIASICHKLFNSCSKDVLSKEYLSPLIKAFNKIKAVDLNFDPLEIEQRDKRLSDYQRAPVTYMALQEKSTHTMAVFVLKDGNCLPLHDHPHMFGMLKVISGKVKLTSYSVVESEPLPPAVDSDLVNIVNNRPADSVGSGDDYQTSLKIKKHVNLKNWVRPLYP